jgi:hypothetical protein
MPTLVTTCACCCGRLIWSSRSTSRRWSLLKKEQCTSATPTQGKHLPKEQCSCSLLKKIEEEESICLVFTLRRPFEYIKEKKDYSLQMRPTRYVSSYGSRRFDSSIGTEIVHLNMKEKKLLLNSFYCSNGTNLARRYSGNAA